jgi:hypothetical protein
MIGSSPWKKVQHKVVSSICHAHVQKYNCNGADTSLLEQQVYMLTLLFRTKYGNK